MIVDYRLVSLREISLSGRRNVCGGIRTSVKETNKRALKEKIKECMDEKKNGEII